MKINKIDIEKRYGCKVCSFAYQPHNYSAEFFKSDNSESYMLINGSLQPQERVLVMEFWRVSDISNLIAELIKNPKSILDIDDGYIYEVTYKGGNSPSSQIWNDYYEVSLAMSCIQKGRKVTGKLTRLVNHIHVQGTWSAPCRYIIKPLKDITTFTIDGYVIKNLKKGLPFVIDGVHKLVECNGVNRFGDVDMSKFPVLEPGNYIIKLSSLDAEVTYEYDPIYM